MTNGLTVKALRAPVSRNAPDQWLSDGAVRGSGALWARRSRRGVSLYFRYTHEGQKRALPLGAWNESGNGGLTLAQARERAAALSAIYRGGTTDLHGHVQREREATERAQKAADEAARRAAEDAQRGTLRQLIEAYTRHLERQGKQSAKDAHSILTRHVLEAAPDLAGRKASELGIDDFVGLIGRLVEAGKGRTAAKLRSYLRAAYQLALASRTDPTAPLTMRSFGIMANPISGIGALSKYSRARDRNLSAPELGAFLRRIDALEPGPKRDALHLLLLLGGQRPLQLLRLRAGDVDLSAGSVTLSDPKGARQQPRRHALPLVKEAAAILRERIDGMAASAPVFSTDGETPMRHETLSVTVAEISEAMVRAGEAREAFQLRDLRRTCETLLAGLGVSSDVRAQIQSHGLGGVQARHYDRHDYSTEKRRALVKWSRHLSTLQEAKK